MKGRLSTERRVRRVVLLLLAVCISIATGMAIARWAVGDTNGFYMNLIDRYGRPAYARQQPVADTFWQRQDDGLVPRNAQAGATSTATSAQPAYRSASGS